jgi:hypothetical protein
MEGHCKILLLGVHEGRQRRQNSVWADNWSTYTQVAVSLAAIADTGVSESTPSLEQPEPDNFNLDCAD